MNEILQLEPHDLWYYFSEISKIPHPSKHEKEIANYIYHLLSKKGLDCEIDPAGNVIARKKATPGLENAPVVALQAHMDMVPQKEEDKEFDFLKDSLELLVDGDFVKANGTTLGADNGIGLVAILAILMSDNLKHGPLEAIFTVDEEEGLTGAQNFAPNVLKAKYLLNLDSEEEFLIGCAGGIFAKACFSPKYEEIDHAKYQELSLKVTGLQGGHSGADIHLQRGNAIKILIHLLAENLEKYDFRLASINGGTVKNAIPRSAEGKVFIRINQKADFIASINEITKKVRHELKEIDQNFAVIVQEVVSMNQVIDQNTQKNFLLSLQAMHDGIFTMSVEVPELVETSTNLGVIETKENKITAHWFFRSSNEALLTLATQRFAALFTLAKAQISFSDPNPAWQPNVNSELLKKVKATHQRLFNNIPKVGAVHAGLECGCFYKTYPDLDMISFGMDIRGAHSPNERVSISSVQKFWKFLTELLIDLAK